MGPESSGLVVFGCWEAESSTCQLLPISGCTCKTSSLWALLSLHSATDLSELLKEGTKESHDRAENTQFVKDFLKGRIKRELFKVRLAVCWL